MEGLKGGGHDHVGNAAAIISGGGGGGRGGAVAVASRFDGETTAHEYYFVGVQFQLVECWSRHDD